MQLPLGPPHPLGSLLQLLKARSAFAASQQQRQRQDQAGAGGQQEGGTGQVAGAGGSRWWPGPAPRRAGRSQQRVLDPPRVPFPPWAQAWGSSHEWGPMPTPAPPAAPELALLQGHGSDARDGEKLGMVWAEPPILCPAQRGGPCLRVPPAQGGSGPSLPRPQRQPRGAEEGSARPSPWRGPPAAGGCTVGPGSSAERVPVGGHRREEE